MALNFFFFGMILKSLFQTRSLNYGSAGSPCKRLRHCAFKFGCGL